MGLNGTNTLGDSTYVQQLSLSDAKSMSEKNIEK